MMTQLSTAIAVLTAIEQYDTVVLTEAISLPDHQFEEGDEGIVVGIDQQGLGYAVEFFEYGYTVAVLSLTASQVCLAPQPEPAHATDDDEF